MNAWIIFHAFVSLHITVLSYLYFVDILYFFHVGKMFFIKIKIPGKFFSKEDYFLLMIWEFVSYDDNGLGFTSLILEVRF